MSEFTLGSWQQFVPRRRPKRRRANVVSTRLLRVKRCTGGNWRQLVPPRPPRPKHAKIVSKLFPRKKNGVIHRLNESSRVRYD